MNKIIVLVFLMAMCLNGMKLEANDSCRIKFTDLSIQNGFFIQPDFNINLQDARTLAPESAILKNAFAGYFYNNNGYNTATGNIFTMLLSLQVRNKKTGIYNPNRQFRIGFSSVINSDLSALMEKSQRFTVSSSPGKSYDSVETKRLMLVYTSTQLRIDASCIFRTDATARWSLYTGIGISGGISFTTNVAISYAKTYYINPNSLNSQMSQISYLTESESEFFRLKRNFGASAYVPLGIDFRVGKSRPFWKRLHLYVEGRPGINMLIVPELQAFTNGYIHNSIGLRVSF